jgi:5-methylcytosine-specific restriction endonuclease McrA
MSEWHDTPAWREARAKAKKILEPTCVTCHKELLGNDFTIDHIIPPAKTGGIPNHALENLQAMCRSCNGRKSDTTHSRKTEISPRWRR